MINSFGTLKNRWSRDTLLYILCFTCRIIYSCLYFKHVQVQWVYGIYKHTLFWYQCQYQQWLSIAWQSCIFKLTFLFLFEDLWSVREELLQAFPVFYNPPSDLIGTKVGCSVGRVVRDYVPLSSGPCTEDRWLDSRPGWSCTASVPSFSLCRTSTHCPIW